MKIYQKLLAALLLTASILSAETTIVTVNGKKITQEQVFKVLMQGTQGGYTQMPLKEQQKWGSRVLNQMIEAEIIYSNAKKTGVLKSKEYKAALKKEQEALKKRLAIQVWSMKEAAKVKVTNKKLKAYYKANKGEFMYPAAVKVSHILVKTKKEANAAISALKGLKGKDLSAKFASIAIKQSSCSSAPKGGDLGYVTEKSPMVPEFKKAALKMKVGEVSKKPVKTQFGYHVLYITAAQAKKQATFKEAKPMLKERLKAELAMKAIPKKVKALYKKAKIVYTKKK